jgi:acetyl esterase/lipase
MRINSCVWRERNGSQIEANFVKCEFFEVPSTRVLSVSILESRRWVCFSVTLLAMCAPLPTALAGEPESRFVWPDLAPGESQRDAGETLPFREGEAPPITRLVNIRRPSLDLFLPEEPNGTAILVLPGGGFGKVVPDKEGSEAAPWLNGLGIATVVLRYRTNEMTPESEPVWRRPLQDAQRAIRVMRDNAKEWRIQPDRIGVLAFSAGGQVGAILHTSETAAYQPIDATDQQSFRPDFSLLIYPWRVLDEESGQLMPEIHLTEKSPPAFIVHTHDDRSSSIGSVLIYAGLKRHNVPAELHVYGNGGHGYGMRAVKDSNIGTWPNRATDWLVRRKLAGD